MKWKNISGNRLASCDGKQHTVYDENGNAFGVRSCWCDDATPEQLARWIDPENFTPTEKWLEWLKPGIFAPDCFGKMRRVAEIAYTGTDVNGKKYVGVYLRFGPNSRISESYKVDRKHITINNA